MSMAYDWWVNGPQCLNCGERVLDAEKILDENGVVFKGMCKSKVCIELPPGGNPFMHIMTNSKGQEEE
jgi:hypothetical protein